MKIKIEYKYDISLPHPFVAFSELNGKKANMFHYISGWSDNSFDEAKGMLLIRFSDLMAKQPTIIPEPEEVEVA